MARYPLDSPQMADFMNNLDLINGLAEKSDGFIWRYHLAAGEPTGVPQFDNAPIIVNMSLWHSEDALKTFAYKTLHKRFFGRKGEWFTPMATPHLALWWREAGTLPRAEDGARKLEQLANEGPSEEVFTFDYLSQE